MTGVDLIVPTVEPDPTPLPSALAAFGWTSERDVAFADHAAAGLVAGRVVSTGGVMRAMTADGSVDVVFQRRFKRGTASAADLPAVGDWLALEPMISSGMAAQQAAIRTVLPRTSAFARGEATSGQHVAEQVVAANVDTAFLVSALNHELNPRRIERYLLLAWASGTVPVIVLNKADLASELATALAAVAAVAGDVPIHVVSAMTHDGLAGLRPYLGPGQTVCLLGSSGVGKSTLANALLGEERQLVGAERADDSRGRHTTTARELFPLPGGALLIDTPGLRSVGLWDGGSGLEQAFDDIARLADGCRFTDCRHESEPGCAVLAAIASGELAEARLESHRKLEKELRALDLRADAPTYRAANRRFGKMTRDAGKTAQRRKEADG